MQHGASIVYKSKRTGKTYITFCMLPGDEFDDYFPQQVCMHGNWVYVSSQAEANPYRRRTPDEIARGLIRKPVDFLNKGEHCDEEWL